MEMHGTNGATKCPRDADEEGVESVGLALEDKGGSRVAIYEFHG